MLRRRPSFWPIGLFVCSALLNACGRRAEPTAEVGFSRPCRMADYSPQTLLLFSFDHLAPWTYVILSEMNKPHNVAPGRRGVIRRGLLVAQVSEEIDVRKRTSKLFLYDMSGNPLFWAAESNFPCPADKPTGRCTATEFDFESEKIEGGAPAFRVIESEKGKIRYERYGQNASFFGWSQGVRGAIEWLLQVMKQLPAFAPIPQSAHDGVKLILAGDPYLAIYADDFQYRQNENRWTVRGTLPDASYLERAKKLYTLAGMDPVSYEIVIRGGPKVRPETPPGRCFGFVGAGPVDQKNKTPQRKR